MAKQIIKAGVNQPEHFVTTNAEGSLETTILKNELVYANTIAQPNGVASLDENGKVPITQLPDAILGAVIYQGTWNASTNTPTIVSGVGVQGHYYVVSEDGTTDIDGTDNWLVGDWIIFNGTIWQRVDNTQPDVLDTILTGFAPVNSAITSTDTILNGFNKTQGQIDALVSMSGDFIPRTGTTLGNPVTGNIEFNDGVKLYGDNSSTGGFLQLFDERVLLKGDSQYMAIDDNITAGNLFSLTVNPGAVSNFLMLTNASLFTLGSTASENIILGHFTGTEIYSMRNIMLGLGGGNIYNVGADLNVNLGACSGNVYNGSYNANIGIGSGNEYNGGSSNNMNLGSWTSEIYGSASNNNVNLGSGSVNFYTASSNNVQLGTGASNTFNSANYNMLLGQNSGNVFSSGASYNTLLGNRSGNNLTGIASILAGTSGGNTLGNTSFMFGTMGDVQLGDNNYVFGSGGSGRFLNGSVNNFMATLLAAPIIDASSFNSLLGRAISASRDFQLLNSYGNTLLGLHNESIYDNCSNSVIGGNIRGIFTGSNNVVMGLNYNGLSAVNSLNGSHATILGQHLDMNVTGDNQTMIGRTITATLAGSGNTLLGYFGDYAGLTNIQGLRNTLIGAFNGGGVTIDNASNYNVLIGNLTGISLAGINNKVIVPNLSYYSGPGLISSLVTGVITGSRTWTLPDNSGTIALTSDIAASVAGPVSSTDNAIARFDATTGKIIQNSGVLIDDNNNVSGVGYIQVKDVSAPANPGSGLGCIYKKTGNAGLFWKPDAAGAEVDLTASGGGSSATKRMYQFSLCGEASSTLGQLAKASDKGAAANPSGRPSTSSGDPGINNGAVDPYLVPESASIKKIRIKFSGAAVGTGTVGTPTVRLRVYRVDYSTRTQLGSDIDIAISTTGVGTFGNTAGNAFQSAVSGVLSIAVTAGDLIGLEFVNQASTNNGINAIANLFAVIETEE